ncbi:hypothetical protein O3P69_000974 [Scylla paramamosain]|uniref:Uncharacterized protein n=1 Tax=Scylla paramamosain TaxID=85552 RepID=A0AAW0USM1_SCYPA
MNMVVSQPPTVPGLRSGPHRQLSTPRQQGGVCLCAGVPRPSTCCPVGFSCETSIKLKDAEATKENRTLPFL